MISPLVLLLRKNLFLLLRLLLLLRWMRRFWSKRIANFNLFFKVVIILSCCLCLVISLLLSSFWTRHHTCDSLRTTSIDKGPLRANSSCCSNLGLRTCWFLHTRLEVVHVARRLIYLLYGRNFISSFWSLRDVKVACWILIVAQLCSRYISIAFTLSTEQVQPLFLIIGCLFISQNELLLCS